MPVDLLERRQQPRAALAVEIADRPAQPVDRLLQLVALGDAGGAAFLNLHQLALGDKIDRAKPFAVERQAFKQGRTLADLVHLGRIEADPFGEQRRRTFEPLASNPVDLLTALLLRSEEHTSELKSLMRTSYAVFCL